MLNFTTTHSRGYTSDGRSWDDTRTNSRHIKAEAFEESERKHFGMDDVRPHIGLTTSLHRKTFVSSSGLAGGSEEGRKGIRLKYCGKIYKSLNEMARDTGYHLTTIFKAVKAGKLGPDKIEVLP